MNLNLIQAFKFAIVGSINTITTFVIYSILVSQTHLSYSVSLFISYVIGILMSYILNSGWTFKSKLKKIPKILKFITVYVFVFIINLALLFIFVEYFVIGEIISQGISVFITTTISFLTQKYWVFNNKVKGESNSYD